MFSFFDYLRQLVRDSVLAGVQDAFEIMDQGNHRDTIAAAAQKFLGRSSPSNPRPRSRPPARATQSEAQRTQVPSQPPADLIPSSFQVPSPELPKLDGYDNYERRKKTPGRDPKQQNPRSS